jgi:hypothetical protein
MYNEALFFIFLFLFVVFLRLCSFKPGMDFTGGVEELGRLNQQVFGLSL